MSIQLYELHDEDHVEQSIVFAESASEAIRRYSTEIVELGDDATAVEYEPTKIVQLYSPDDPIDDADVPKGGGVSFDQIYKCEFVSATAGQWCEQFAASGLTFGILSESL